jgi:glycine reductase
LIIDKCFLPHKKGESIIMAILEGKKAIIIGDRDGIPGPAIAECVQTAGAEVVFSSTECFV